MSSLRGPTPEGQSLDSSSDPAVVVFHCLCMAGTLAYVALRLPTVVAQDLEERRLRDLNVARAETLQLCFSSFLLFEVFHLRGRRLHISLRRAGAG